MHQLDFSERQAGARSKIEKILGASWQKFTRGSILGAMPPTPDGTLCEPGTLRRQSIDTLKSASNSLAPGNTEGSVSRTEFSVKLHLEVTRMTLALSRAMETRTVFFRAFLHNTKEIVPGQLE
ncbi:hypothetical protein, partial [Duodenibacillus massiliensis]|uniref:hypothetical protein n=1 Tax=Duodenibacillus massiliensis TaxID=1852381 RepID=UPI003076F200